MSKNNPLDLPLVLKVLRRPEILEITGLSKTTLFEHIKSGLFPKFIRLGKRSVGIFEHEARALILARASEKNEEDIRKLVKQLLVIRKKSATEFLRAL